MHSVVGLGCCLTAWLRPSAPAILFHVCVAEQSVERLDEGEYGWEGVVINEYSLSQSSFIAVKQLSQSQ